MELPLARLMVVLCAGEVVALTESFQTPPETLWVAPGTDGVIVKMFIEQERPGDPYDVSDADTMLAYLAPNAPRPLDATVFTRKGCPHCARAKHALDEAGIAYEELVLNRDFTDRTLRAVTARTTFPQVFVNGEHVGGADDLEKWLRGRVAA